MRVRLDVAEVIETIERLECRIRERFPAASLAVVARNLGAIARATAENVRLARRPHWPLRVGVSLFLLATGVLVVVVLSGENFDFDKRDILRFTNFFQLFESLVSSVVFVGAAIVYLFSLESRMKRRRALRALDDLRGMAHIVDMHQLTKDPERLLVAGPSTPSSPQRTLTPFELNRYLDYCTEVLSVTSKVSALWAQGFDDPVVLAAVDQVEVLTTGLSRKIWQKIMVLEQLVQGGRLVEPEAPSRTPDAD